MMMSAWRSSIGLLLSIYATMILIDLSRRTKLIFYTETLKFHALSSSAESWTLLSIYATALKVFEGKVIRKIFGAVRVDEDFRIRSNTELY